MLHAGADEEEGHDQRKHRPAGEHHMLEDGRQLALGPEARAARYALADVVTCIVELVDLALPDEILRQGWREETQFFELAEVSSRERTRAAKAGGASSAAFDDDSERSFSFESHEDDAEPEPKPEPEPEPEPETKPQLSLIPSPSPSGSSSPSLRRNLSLEPKPRV